MSFLTSYLFYFLFIIVAQSLQITNITCPVPLTSIFYNESSSTSLIEFEVDFMTYYINPKDPTKTKYLWLGTNDRINDSKMGSIRTSLKSDIFDMNFVQYNNEDINNLLPMTISKSSDNINDTSNIDDIIGNFMCTSPITNDIFTCWMNVTSYKTIFNVERYFYNVQCRIFFVKTNSFSNIINITAPYNNQSEAAIEILNYPAGILCFNDAYYVPYFTVIYPVSTNSYFALIDLDGNIVYDQKPLHLNLSVGNVISPLFATKASYLYKINNKEYETFTIVYENYNANTNISNISGAYGYYTNIHDTTPITIYQDHIINHQSNKEIYKGQYNMELWFPLNINYTKDCCYIYLYRYDHSENNGYKDDIYAIFTDFNGNNINISQASLETNFEDILLIKNVDDFLLPMIFDLPMISTDNSHYFMITYSNSSTNDNEGNTIIAAIYYLMYDSEQYIYNLEFNGAFNTVQLVNDEDFDNYNLYIMPDTNKMLYAWTESYQSSYLMYGQTWQIK